MYGGAGAHACNQKGFSDGQRGLITTLVSFLLFHLHPNSLTYDTGNFYMQCYDQFVLFTKWELSDLLASKRDWNLYPTPAWTGMILPIVRRARFQLETLDFLVWLVFFSLVYFNFVFFAQVLNLSWRTHFCTLKTSIFPKFFLKHKNEKKNRYLVGTSQLLFQLGCFKVQVSLIWKSLGF